MKIGMLSGLWYVAEGASLIESLQRSAALGLHYVDFQGSFHAGPRHLSERDRSAVGRELERLGLEPRNYVLHAPHNIPSAGEAEQRENLAYLKEGVDLAVAWGFRQMMLNAGQWAYGVTRQEAWSRSAAFLRAICDYAGERGVYIAQETEPYVWFLVHDLASARAMAAEVDRANFSILVDLGHMALARESAADLSPFAHSIIHAHFSDHEPYRHTNQVIGTGCTPTADYLQYLSTLERDGLLRRFGYEELVVSFELGSPGDKIADPDSWVRRSIEHVLSISPDISV